MGKVISVNISERKGTIKHPVEQIELKINHGIVNDAHAGDWHRQVSLLDLSSFDKMHNRASVELKPGIFAENITTEGVDLWHLPIGTRLEIGETLLEITQIGKECHRHCQVFQQVGDCVMPREGIFVKVIKEGTVRAGQDIKIIPIVRVAILTVSDKGSTGERADLSGPALAEALQGKAIVMMQEIVPDDFEQIKDKLIEYAEQGLDLVFTTGGTGFAPRDNTPEATMAVVERPTPGIVEAIRAQSMKFTPFAMLSRASAGIRGKTLIINFPGSPKAAVECLEVFLPVMNHAVETLRGDACECARP
ncbi:MAG TPA: molybdenum cofactor biosynthesis protein [Anaerolineaceae bacterium]|jgi:molybdenum cofactor synthesis domain-containing protein|nr:molybdenum cofactor biosynthesis protein [Anaerolineaceae bacterium]